MNRTPTFRTITAFRSLLLGVKAGILLFCCLLFGAAPFVAAQNTINYDNYCSENVGCAWYDPNSNTCGQTDVTGAPGVVDVNEIQLKLIKTIIGVAKTFNLGQKGATIGIMAALTESGIKNYANTGVPISMQNPAWLSLPEPRPLGHDHDSVGIMQQRPSTGWSTIATGDAALGNKDAVWQIMDPAYSSQAFFGSPPGSSAPPAVSKGLQNVSGWQNLDPWVAAQKVQISGSPDGSNYKKNYDKAVAIVSANYDASPAVPLAISVSGGNNGSGGDNTQTCTSDINCDSNAAVGNVSSIRSKVVCLARAEKKLWDDGALKPGTHAYYKYSQGRSENWCADFASWIYNQAGYPLSGGRDGNVPLVDTIRAIGQSGGKFQFHPSSGYSPRPGDLAIHKGPNISHVNIVTGFANGKVTTIGGNQVTYDFDTSRVSEGTMNSVSGESVVGYVTPD